MSDDPNPVSAQDQRSLLRVARCAAEAALKGAAYERASDPTVVKGAFGGAFVTLWNGRALRGCIGRFVETLDIVAVVGAAGGSVVRDGRFAVDPVTLDEMSRINVEVSVLSALMPVEGPAAIVPGVHGIVVRKGPRTGCFLPKVATERSWTAEEFLTQCCLQKAGLDGDAWRSEDTQVLVFTARVFSEAVEN